MAVYSKILTATDISTRLEVNASSLGDFFPPFPAGQYQQVLVVEEENGKNWEFSLRIRRGQYEKPYISQGTWHPFVEKIQAEVDDKVEFSTGSAGRYKIRVMKPLDLPVRLFGSTIDYVPRIPNN